MSSIEVRPFRRADREQLTALVNAHASAAVPGVSASVNAVMSQLEREPGEFIVDPWVCERLTLVAEQKRRVGAAAHLLRYSPEDHVGDSYRAAAEIRWFLFWPEAPAEAAHWPSSAPAANALIEACLGQLDEWNSTVQLADGALPVPGVYGVPAQWPHVRVTYERAGFVHEGATEIVYVADVADLPLRVDPPLTGLSSSRSVGINGTRLSAVLEGEVVGYVEVQTVDDGLRIPRHGGLADIGNLQVAERCRRQGIATWLVAEAADWLRLARVDRVLDYSLPEQEDYVGFLRSVGFRELTRTERGWVRRPAADQATATSRTRRTAAGRR
jgi:ribosomal protein S18 acetylase RimI-like enzyme